MKELIYKNENDEIMVYGKYKISDNIFSQILEKIEESIKKRQMISCRFVIKNNEILMDKFFEGKEHNVESDIEKRDVGFFHTLPFSKEISAGDLKIIFDNPNIFICVGSKNRKILFYCLKRAYISDQNLRKKLYVICDMENEIKILSNIDKSTKNFHQIPCEINKEDEKRIIYHKDLREVIDEYFIDAIYETIDNRKLLTQNYLGKKFEKESLDALENLLKMRFKSPKKVNFCRIPDAVSIDDKIGVELSIFHSKDILNDKDYEQIMKEMNNYEYRLIDNDITYSGNISLPIKVIIEVGKNNWKKLWKKINHENNHFFNKETNLFEYERSIIILNCKYFMYDDIFSDCLRLLKEKGNSERYDKLIGILIIYPKYIKDISITIDSNILIRNPHCKCNPFTNLVVYEGQKLTSYGTIPMSAMYSIQENIGKIHLKEMIKLVKDEVITKYYRGRILGYHTIGIKNCILINVTLDNREIEIVDND